MYPIEGGNQNSQKKGKNQAEPHKVKVYSRRKYRT